MGNLKRWLLFVLFGFITICAILIVTNAGTIWKAFIDFPKDNLVYFFLGGLLMYFACLFQPFRKNTKKSNKRPED